MGAHTEWDWGVGHLYILLLQSNIHNYVHVYYTCVATDVTLWKQ